MLYGSEACVPGGALLYRGVALDWLCIEIVRTLPMDGSREIMNIYGQPELLRAADFVLIVLFLVNIKRLNFHRFKTKLSVWLLLFHFNEAGRTQPNTSSLLPSAWHKEDGRRDTQDGWPIHCRRHGPE